MPLSSHGAMPAVVALDVGGTAIKGAVLDESGVLVSDSAPTNAHLGPEGSLESVIREVSSLLEKVPGDRRPVAVGLAVPGTVDDAAGRVVNAENLDWVDLPIAQIVSEATGLPVGFGHDVRTAGIAEWRLGAGMGREDLAYISIGTGIAAAIVLGGQLIVSHGYCGEIGHGGATDGEPCACGGKGCAETFASAAGIAREYGRLTGNFLPGAKEVLDAARAGDVVAQRVWDRAVDYLGELASQVVRVTGVSSIVVGGGLVRAGSALMTPMRHAMASRLTIHRKTELIEARLGSSAGTFGAALIGWEAAGLQTPLTWAALNEQEESA